MYVCIYIYIGIVWLRAPNQSRPFHSSWTQTLWGGRVKRAQLLWNVHNFLQMWTTSMNSMTSSQTLQRALNQTIHLYMWVCLKIGYPKRQWFIQVRHQFLLNKKAIFFGHPKRVQTQPDIFHINNNHYRLIVRMDYRHELLIIMERYPVCSVIFEDSSP